MQYLKSTFLNFCRSLRLWAGDGTASSAAEFALIFPLMFAMIVAIWDLGNGIVINQKTIAASQIVVDLICREESISNAELQEAFQAGMLAMTPYPTTNMKIEVASVSYDASDVPYAIFDDSSDGGAVDAALVGRTLGLGLEGNGAVVVQVTYQYDPLFSGVVIGTIMMNERVFSRGRKSALVCRDGLPCV